jgi:hypothetical protein
MIGPVLGVVGIMITDDTEGRSIFPLCCLSNSITLKLESVGQT